MSNDCGTNYLLIMERSHKISLLCTIIFYLWWNEKFTYETLHWVLQKCVLLAYLVGAFIVILYFKQERILYVPQPNKSLPRSNFSNPENMRSPVEWNLPYEEVRMKCSDHVLLHGWFIRHPTEMNKRYTILYFHGNASNIGSRLPFYAELFTQLDVNILTVDYRGYGDSEGEPSEPGLNIDAVTALEYLYSRPDIDHKKIIVFGRSLGGAVAISLLHSHADTKNHQHPVAGLIIENTFTSIADVAVNVLWPLRCLHPKIVAPLLSSKWISKDKIGELNMPILFISGLMDEIIPCSQMAKLYDIAIKRDPNQKRQPMRTMKTFTEGKHNDTPLKGGQEYYDTFMDYLDAIETQQRRDQVGQHYC